MVLGNIQSIFFFSVLDNNVIHPEPETQLYNNVLIISTLVYIGHVCTLDNDVLAVFIYVPNVIMIYL